MAGTYVLGETKVRPGAYFNIQKKGTGQQSGTVSGVTAVLFRSDFGPLNTAVELNPDDGFANTFGNGGTTDAIQEAINGGAQTIIACRVGNGGTSATATLNTAEGQAAVKITAAYPGKNLRKSNLPQAQEKQKHLQMHLQQRRNSKQRYSLEKTRQS